jgi:hypothetical protein
MAEGTSGMSGLSTHITNVIDGLRCDARDAERERDEARAEAEHWQWSAVHWCELAQRFHRLCKQVDAHYGGSLDSQPAYVRSIRAALSEDPT